MAPIEQRVIALLSLFGIACSSLAATPLITFGGGYPGDDLYPARKPDVGEGLYFGLNGLSKDGSTVFGPVEGAVPAGAGYWWTRADGLNLLPQVPTFASVDGSVLAGDRFYWSKSKGTMPLPFTVTGLSADGSTLIGNDPSGGVRWTATGGSTRLGFSPQALSGDGRVITGAKDNNVMIWTDGREKNLGNLGGTDHVASPPETFLSRDGNTIVGAQPVSGFSIPYAGFVSSRNGPVQPIVFAGTIDGISGDGHVAFGLTFRSIAIWKIEPSSVTGGTVLPEAQLQLSGGGLADASFDGSVLVTRGNYALFYYDAAGGLVPLLSALRARGIDVSAVAIDPRLPSESGFYHAFVSDDGHVIASDYRNLALSTPGLPSFWLANLSIPEFSAGLWLAAGLSGVLLAAGRRRAAVLVHRRRRSRVDPGRALPAASLVAACFAVSAALAPVAVSAYASEWRITELGSLGGAYSLANDINNSGQIVGTSLTGAGLFHAFLYDKGKMKDLGTLGGDHSFGSGINEAGRIVGWSYKPPNQTSGALGFQYSNGRMTELLPLPGDHDGSAKSINRFGQIAGESQTLSGPHAIFYHDSRITDLGTLAGARSRVSAVNDLGQVVGTSDTNVLGIVARGFLYENGEMKDLGSLGGGASSANDINNQGQIVGEATIKKTYPDSHAFLYENGRMKDLGTLGGIQSTAYAINNAGQIVGVSSLADKRAPFHAFLYDNGGMIDLSVLPAVTAAGWTTLSATGINDRGQIIGSGSLGNQTRAFLLTPVPEASKWLAIVLGLAGCGVLLHYRAGARTLR